MFFTRLTLVKTLTKNCRVLGVCSLGVYMNGCVLSVRLDAYVLYRYFCLIHCNVEKQKSFSYGNEGFVENVHFIRRVDEIKCTYHHHQQHCTSYKLSSTRIENKFV